MAAACKAPSRHEEGSVPRGLPNPAPFRGRQHRGGHGIPRRQAVTSVCTIPSLGRYLHLEFYYHIPGGREAKKMLILDHVASKKGRKIVILYKGQSLLIRCGGVPVPEHKRLEPDGDAAFCGKPLSWMSSSGSRSTGNPRFCLSGYAYPDSCRTKMECTRSNGIHTTALSCRRSLV